MHSDLKKSVISVPPLARKADLSLDRQANEALIRYLEAGGVSTLMYGGNANFYNIGIYEYAGLLDMLLELASPASWVIPSAGPDFGKMMDQAQPLRDRPFPTAMVLPAGTFSTADGAEAGIARFAERLGKPVIAYIKSEGYLTPDGIARLVKRGSVCAIKYAIVRTDPHDDPYLTELVDKVDRSIIVSGIGERPAVADFRAFKLASFTSGSVCIAPRASMQILHALQRGDFATADKVRAAFLPLEDCRDAWNPMRVLHEAVTLAGIADMGPVLPLMSNLDAGHHDAVRNAARTLRSYDQSLAAAAA